MAIPKQFNTDRNIHFVLLESVAFKQETDGPNIGQIRPAIGSISFSSYVDKAGVFGNPGRTVMYVKGFDSRNKPVGKYFTLSQSHNAFLVNEVDRDSDPEFVEDLGNGQVARGKTMFDFLANSPFCVDSPNGTYIMRDGQKVQVNAKYKLMDTEADALVALEAAEKRTKAQASVLELDAETLLEVATVGIGYKGTEKLMRHKTLEWAGKRPDDYFEILKAGDRSYRALIRKAIQDGVLYKKGDMIFWESTMLGTNEDKAVETLINDPLIVEGLKDKVKVEFQEPEKRKAGRPKKK